jgi:hypothetical protein
MRQLKIATCVILITHLRHKLLVSDFTPCHIHIMHELKEPEKGKEISILAMMWKLNTRWCSHSE